MRARQTETHSSRRALLIAWLFLLWMAVIVGRLAYLQVSCHQDYQRRAELQREEVVTVAPLRGAILDRRGEPLARSVEADSLYAYKRLMVNPEQVARHLAPLLGQSEGDWLKKIAAARNFVWLKRKLDFETADKVRSEIERNRLEGVYLIKEPRRFYPNGSLAAHIIGQVDIDEKGIEGLEKAQDEHLCGTTGRIFLQRDARNRPYDRYDSTARSGARVVLTLDAALQHKVELVLEEALQATRARGASAIVLNPQTGEILALANVPTFDLNQRPRRRPEGEEGYLRRNRAITDIYEPGSVFKIVTFSAAIEEGLAQPDEKIDCLRGEITLGNHTIRDTHAYGVITVAEALAKSSNVGAIKLAQRVGKRRLADYIARFGFGRKSGVDLPGEAEGLVPDVSRWQVDSLGSIAIGYGVGVSALQTVAAVAAIANRGLWVQPHIVKRVVDPDERVLYEARPRSRRVISEKTSLAVVSMLEGVVRHGTARHAIQLASYTAAGKTGTTKKFDPVTKRYSSTRYVASFAGFVPASDPRFAIIVTFDEPVGLHYGGQVAAPVFSRIAEFALSDYLVPPDKAIYHETVARLEKASNPQPLGPDLVGESRPPAHPPSNQGEEMISYQMPLRKNEPDRMPDLRGRGMRAVAQECNRLGLRMKMSGYGAAVSQQPAPGARIKPGDICWVEFR